MAGAHVADCQGVTWWREKEVLWLLLLVVAAHFIRLPTLSLRGEEPRRALVALEMMRTGDWLVPRQQGEPFLSRPPLQNWLLALSIWLRGDCDLWAIRLPGALAVLLTTLLIYGYARSFLSRLGALGAAAGFATMIEVLTLGRLAETESLFTLLLSASLLTWHWGWERDWPAAGTWTLSYCLAALATLTKGPQAPVYFVGAVGGYLLLRREGHRLLTRAHLLGLLAFGLLVGGWLVPFALELGWDDACAMFTGDVGIHYADTNEGQALVHLLSYPFEVLASTAPWSLLLAAYLARPFRAVLGRARQPVLFLTVCTAVAFPTCWLAPDSRSRYFMPLYPCLAVLAGVVLERICAAAASSPLARLRKAFLAACLGLIAGIALLVVSGSWLAQHTRLRDLGEAPTAAVVCAAAAVAAAFLVYRGFARAGARSATVAVLALASFLALSNTLPYIDFLDRKSHDPAPDVASIRALIPTGERLVSFGPVHHRFALEYGTPIPLVTWPESGIDTYEDVTWFCVQTDPNDKPILPFPWEEVGIVACDRYLRAEFQENIVIGRRLRS